MLFANQEAIIWFMYHLVLHETWWNLMNHKFSPPDIMYPCQLPFARIHVSGCQACVINPLLDFCIQKSLHAISCCRPRLLQRKGADGNLLEQQLQYPKRRLHPRLQWAGREQLSLDLMVLEDENGHEWTRSKVCLRQLGPEGREARPGHNFTREPGGLC